MTETPKMKMTWSWPGVLQNRWLMVVVILLVWGLCYLPGLSVRDMRLEEGRRATPAAEMLRNQQYVLPTLYDQAYLNKPPCFFWVVAGMGKVQGWLEQWGIVLGNNSVGSVEGGVNEFTVRIASVLGVLLGAWLLLVFAFREMRFEMRALAALVFMSLPFLLDKGTVGEIDVALSLETFVALLAMWNAFDGEKEKISWWGWLVAGGALALATLTKGPSGLIQFYALFVPFIFWGTKRGGWRIFFSPGHFILLVVALVPSVWWVVLVMEKTGLRGGDLLALWSTQTGVKMFMGEKSADTTALDIFFHYSLFVIRLGSMLAPWVLVLVPLWIPGWRKFLGLEIGLEDHGSKIPHGQRMLWRYCGTGLLLLVLIFWLWPSGNPRYLMVIVFPIAVMAILAVEWCNGIAKPWCEELRGWWQKIALAIPFVLMLGAMGCCIGAWGIAGTPRLIAVGIAVVAFMMGMFLVGITQNTPKENAHWALVANLALVILVGRGMVAAVLNPRLALTDATRIAHQQMRYLLPEEAGELPTFTTRTFASGKGDGFYNLQFYLPRKVHGIEDISELKQLVPEGKPALVVMTEEEWPLLQKYYPRAEKLGVIHAPKGPPALVLARF